MIKYVLGALFLCKLFKPVNIFQCYESYTLQVLRYTIFYIGVKMRVTIIFGHSYIIIYIL